MLLLQKSEGSGILVRISSLTTESAIDSNCNLLPGGVGLSIRKKDTLSAMLSVGD